jgi:hypothetical protein
MWGFIQRRGTLSCKNFMGRGSKGIRKLPYDLAVISTTL